MVRSNTRSSLSVMSHSPRLSGSPHNLRTGRGGFPTPDQTARFERLEVLEHRRKTHRQRPRQLADRGRSAGKPGEHTAPRRVREGLERAIEPGRIVKHTLNYRVAAR